MHDDLDYSIVDTLMWLQKAYFDNHSLRNISYFCNPSSSDCYSSWLFPGALPCMLGTKALGSSCVIMFSSQMSVVGKFLLNYASF